MKLIIVEGTDNIGKDTIISKLCELFNTVTLIHCGSPKSKIFQSQEQDELFKSYAENIISGTYDKTDVVIMNRSHLGEFVYGQLYRHRSFHDIYKMICDVNYTLKKRKDLTIKYIQLLSSSIKLRKKYDDDKSLAKMDDELMKKENDLFLKVFNCVELDKKLILVNDEDNFYPRKIIFDEVIEFLNT